MSVARMHDVPPRRAVPIHLALTFLISWGGMLLVIGGPAHVPASPSEFDRLLPVVALTLAAGPAIAAFIATGLLSGWRGVRDLAGRLGQWRVKARWYAVALLTAPVLLLAILLPLALHSAAFLPPVLIKPVGMPTLLLTAFAAVTGGLLEEIGWTGFAIPRLRERHGALTTGLLVGVVWGVWHFLVNVWGAPALAGGLPLTVFVPPYLLAGLAHLTAYRILMVWVYDRTGSLPIAVLMHAALIAGTVQTVLTPPTTGFAFLTWFVGLTMLFWLAVAAVAVGGRSHGRTATVR